MELLLSALLPFIVIYYSMYLGCCYFEKKGKKFID